MTKRPLFLAEFNLLPLLADAEFEGYVLPYRPDWLSASSKFKLPACMESLTPDQAFTMIADDGVSSLIVSERKYPWQDMQKPWLSRMWRMRKNWADKYFVASHKIPELAHRKALPIGFISLADHFQIAAHDHVLLETARKAWVRELPIHHNDLIRNTSLKLRHYASLNSPFANKLNAVESISLGVSDQLHRLTEKLLHSDGTEPKKEYDLFYSCKSTSPVRSQIQKTIQDLREKNAYRIYFSDERLSYDEYIAACLKSYAVVSPSGWGWDCWRHYEAAMCASVPIMNYPTIRRYQPLLEEEHAFYFGVEPGGLEQTLHKAFADRERLREMGRRARAHVIQHHLNSVLLKKITSEVLA